MENPPKGALKFQLASMAPPPPPGFTPSARSAGGPVIPPKYTTPDNGLSFDYSGGNKTFNIDIK
ncbi:hypothetical protein FRUB_00082 [Fimbriiglobus ruber]|uniref:Uncharacterized protein n=2 Tax=Fimbriiglobus ruber TaxID=1908690 RepID=A0A225DZJ0_9BACT|nr:hypothetical protein FRUB_00082 [Fimbriiglobus ruber]